MTEAPRGIFVRLGVSTIINAAGPTTRLGGGRADPEVASAVAEAMGQCVAIETLQERASEIIAEHTGAESGRQRRRGGTAPGRRCLPDRPRPRPHGATAAH